jgi:hypothetical protein
MKFRFPVIHFNELHQKETKINHKRLQYKTGLCSFRNAYYVLFRFS